MGRKRIWAFGLLIAGLWPSSPIRGAEMPSPAAAATLSYSPPAQTLFSFSAFLPTLIFLVVLAGATAMFYWFVNVFTLDWKPEDPPNDSAHERVRKMVVFCYVFMLLTLGAAVSPFILLMLLPQAAVFAIYSYMPDSPVALVVGCVHDSRPEYSHWEIVCQPGDQYMNEWLVSIGGLVLQVGPTYLPSGGNVTAPAPSATISNEGGATSAEPSLAKFALVAATSETLHTAAAPIKKTEAPNGASAQEHPGAPEAAPSLGGSDLYGPWTPDVNLLSGYWNFPPMVIHGGITVPLYFIIVALVGASISLTRKVPEYQRHFFDEDKPFDAFEMREQLVLQILQFLSAPFLAITGYILITPAGPTTSIPLAFVAGYSSETVLRLITSAIENVTKK